jgi:hypothetical protein
LTKQIICIRWGTKYGADYVNRLYAMVASIIGLHETGPAPNLSRGSDSRVGAPLGDRW